MKIFMERLDENLLLDEKGSASVKFYPVTFDNVLNQQQIYSVDQLMEQLTDKAN
jgi:hypothetical protein